MLTAITIKNFTLVESMELDFSQGMTVITGETGAGKSLLLGALGLALGDRADTGRIRHGADRAEASALFDINNLHNVGQWLSANDFECTHNECLLRRIITGEGRSRGAINGQSATMQQLRELGEMLIDIHSQHEHQSLLRRDTHRSLLDNFAGTTTLANDVRQHYQSWLRLTRQLEQLESQSDALSAKKDLLSFQVAELDQLALAENELEDLEKQQQLLANAEGILQGSHALLTLCSQDENVNLQDLLAKALHILQTMSQKPTALEEAEKLLSSARIDIEEAGHEIQHHLDSFELDPERLQAVEERLSAVFLLARKHRVTPDELASKHQQLKHELNQLCGGAEDVEALQESVKLAAEKYKKDALQLSSKRALAAEQLAEAVNQHLSSLSMQGASLSPTLEPLAEGEFSANGLETVEMLISTNPGEPPRPLAKIASGGELSRISLAIQVVAAQTSAIPTLVFDEVDVGIGGATADIVGKLLQELGRSGQVICVTHQPQVAVCADHHLKAHKRTIDQRTESDISTLAEKQRIDEVARMLSGATVTAKTLDHAGEMLALAGNQVVR